MTAVDLFWLSPLLPLGVFGVIALGIAARPRLAIGLAIGGAALAAILAIVSLAAVVGGQRAAASAVWLDVGGRTFTLALMLDPLAAAMATLVCVVGLLVFVYAASYMADDPEVGRFFALMSLFIAAMLALVLAGDLITTFIAWELVGLCSALLIGFWFMRPGAAAAATKAFLITRLGDLALLLAVLLILGRVGSARLDAALAAVAGGVMSPSLVAGIGVLLFIAAATKSAQLPFQSWLPDAMVGPTPVSALLHSATMVAAGVFLIARLYPIFEAVPLLLEAIAWTGALTALLGGAAALVERDLKRALAYSTMSQLGLMFVGLGAGSLIAGVLLLLAHAFYKALLFLAAGLVDRAVEGTEFARMGGLRRPLPWTFVGVVIGAAALAGLPVTVAAPAKDALLTAAWLHRGSLFVLTLAASVLTALYTARIVGLVFLAAPSGPTPRQVKERPGLLGPTLALAALTPVVLLANSDVLGRPLGRLLSAEAPDSLAMTVTTIALAVLGVATGAWAHHRWPDAIVWPPLRAVAPIFTEEFGLSAAYARAADATLRITANIASVDRHVFDPIGDRAAAGATGLVRSASRLDRRVFDRIGDRAASGVVALARSASRFDRAVFDSVATWATAVTLRFIRAAARVDVRRIEAFVASLGRGVLAVSGRLRPLQTGRVDNYLLPLFVWGCLLIALAAVLARPT